MKVGIGVITTQQRKVNSNIFNLISQPTEFYVYTDYERKGCSYGRNECIKHLYDAKCDYIFLFDDDTYPIIKGWEDKIIQWMNKENVHVTGIIDYKTNKATQLINNDTLVFNAAVAGPFLAIDRKAIETVGYYSTKYTIYGWEDVAYCGRCKNAGLCGDRNGVKLPIWLMMYIHDEDMYNETALQTFSDEDKKKGIALNQSECATEVTSSKLYYDYEENQRRKN
jgi:GT2 family glycosyltransferase